MSCRRAASSTGRTDEKSILPPRSTRCQRTLSLTEPNAHLPQPDIVLFQLAIVLGRGHQVEPYTLPVDVAGRLESREPEGAEEP